MLNKYILGLLLICASGLSHGGLVFSSQTTGADMIGIEVTVDFLGGGSETSIWSTYTTDLGTTGNTVVDHEGFSGGVTGTGWSLSQSGLTLGDIDPLFNVYGLWRFSNTSNNVTSVSINTGETGIVFDTSTLRGLSEDTNGSGQGRYFVTGVPAEVAATL